MQRLIARLIGGGPDVEDLLQSSLVTAIAAFPRFRGEAAVSTWLAGIAIRTVHAHLRRPERKRRVVLEVLPERADAQPPPDRRADSRRALERVYEHLGAMDSRQRIAFILHVIDGRSIEETAALMNASRAATKSRVFWARLRLLRRLRKDVDLRDVALEGGTP